jgi:hypothetical protein
MKKNYTHAHGEKRRVVEEFSKRSTRQLFITIPAIVIAGLFFALKNFNHDPVIADYAPKAGFAVVVALLLFSFKNWRCPSCNKYLGKGGAPVFCPKCGAQLKDQ